MILPAKLVKATFWASLIACACAASTIRADDSTNIPAYLPFSIAFDAGTPGVGGSVSWRFSDHFGVRGGIDYFSYSVNSTIEDISYDANLRMLSQMLTLNLFPSKHSSFFVSAGAYFNENRLMGTSKDGFTLNGTTYPAEDVGTLQLRCDQQPVNPYVSIGGNFYFDKARHWSIGAELGLIFTGEPRVSLGRSDGVTNPAIDDAVQQEKQMVEDKIKNYQFLPVLKLSVSFSF